jgi:hypothetical protein
MALGWESDPYKEPRTNNDEQRLRRFVLGWAWNFYANLCFVLCSLCFVFGDWFLVPCSWLGMGFMTLPDPYKEPRTNNDEQRLRRFVLGWASDPHKEHGTKNQEPRVNGQAELLRHARDADERGVVGNVGWGVHGWGECTGFFGIYKRKGMDGKMR